MEDPHTLIQIMHIKMRDLSMTEVNGIQIPLQLAGMERLLARLKAVLLIMICHQIIAEIFGLSLIQKYELRVFQRNR